MAGDFEIILGAIIVIIVVMVLIIRLGGPHFRLPVQVFSFGFHNLILLAYYIVVNK